MRTMRTMRTFKNNSMSLRLKSNYTKIIAMHSELDMYR